MELFDEVYGAYYAAIARVLSSTPLTRAQLRRLLCEELSVDGAQEVEDKLQDGTWPFLIEKGGKYYSALKNVPCQPLTDLECAYLSGLTEDPRSQLFLSDAQLAALRSSLGDIPALYSVGDFDFYDRFTDGDGLTPEYRECFTIILRALSEERWLEFDYHNRKNRFMHFVCNPLTLEYSGKDNRFRLHSVDRGGRYLTQNASQMTNIRLIDPPEFFVPLSGTQEPSLCDEPVVVKVSSERSALTRFMLEFSYLKKKSEMSEDGHSATVRLWYSKADETEILIRLLSFGPTIRILSPEAFVERVRERVRRQTCLLSGCST